MRRNQRIAKIAMALALVSGPLSALALGQTATGTILGIVRDQTGAVIPGARVTIRNVATGVVRETHTNAEGLYRVPGLIPGKYEVTVQAQGFSTEVKRDITVTVGAEQVVDFTLTVGAVTERVEISGGGAAVELVTSTLSYVVDANTIRELPLNGRDWTQLATLQPGIAVVRVQDTSDLRRNQRGNGIQMTIAGGRPSENNYRWNGISINDYANTGPGSVLGTNLGVDAIQEFSVLTSTYSAEYGRTSGGVINAVTRSGANEFHGSTYYFHRNSVLDARNFFDRASDPPPFRRHQFGAAAGGPLVRDRTFWFGDYEGLREFLSVTVISTTLSDRARLGQLSTGTVEVDPAVKPFLGLYPRPNGRLLGAGDVGEFVFTSGRISRQDYATGRLDHRFSERDTVSGAYFLDDAHIDAPDEFNNKAVSMASRRQGLALEWAHTFTPWLLMTSRFGFSRTMAGNGLSTKIFNPLLQDTALGFLPGRAVGEIQVPGLSDFSGGLGGVEFNLFHYNSFQGYQDVFLTRGVHSLKIGWSLERIQNNYDSPFLPNGRFIFGSLVDFLTNKPRQLSAQLPGSDTVRGIRQTLFGAYFHDDVRWRPNVTVNLGLRYEVATVPTEVNGKLANLRRLTDAQPTVGSLFANPTRLNFAPRIGLAWDPWGNGKTSIRAGFGIFDVLPLVYIFTNRFNRTPPFFMTGFASNLPAGAFPKGAFQFLGPTSFRAIFVEPEPSRSYKMQWNLNIQRELFPRVVATVGYVGARGVHLPLAYEDVDIVLPTRTPSGYVWPPTATSRRLNENFGRIAASMWNGDSYYHALQISIRRHFGRGFQAQGSYTWSKSIDTGSSTFSNNEYLTTIGYPYPFDLRLNRGLSDFDLRHNFVVNVLWEIPTPTSWAGPARWIFSGWQLGGIYQASSGLPFTVVLTADRAGTKSSQARNFLGQRPNLIVRPECRSLTNPGNPDRYIKLECFEFPAAGTLGSLGRNTLIGPGLSNLDFSLFKNHRIARLSETFNVQVRLEFFNVLNRTNFAPPDVTRYTIFDSAGRLVGNAGQLTRTNTSSRQIQFGMKIIW